MFDSMSKLKKDGTLALNILYGLGFLVLVPLASICVILTIVGAPLAVISLMLYGVLIYLSIIPTAYVFGEICFGKIIDNKYLLMVVSLLVLYIVKLIPIIGGLVSFVSLLFGLGTY